MSRFNLFWNRLMPRERRFITLGVLVVAVSFCGWKLWASYSTRTQLQDALAELREALLWQQEQAALMQRINTACRLQAPLMAADMSLVTPLLSSNQMSSETSLLDAGKVFTLRASSRNGNNLLRFVHDAACVGFEFDSLTIARLQTGEQGYQASLAFTESAVRSPELFAHYVDATPAERALPLWRWFPEAQAQSATQAPADGRQLAHARIEAVLAGVLLTPQAASATLLVAGQRETVYHVGDELARGVEILGIYSDRVVIREQGKDVQIPLKPFSTRDAAGVASTAGAATVELPGMFANLPVQLSQVAQGIEVGTIAEELQQQADIQTGDVITRVADKEIQQLLADPLQWAEYSMNTELPVTVLRGGQEMTVYVNALGFLSSMLPTPANATSPE
jgi:type II secretory pathway component PulC/type II secretory pathway component PulM